MSWDVMLLNLGGQPPDLAKFEKDFEPPPLGNAQDVRDRISASAPTVDWADPTWGILFCDAWSIEFSLGKNEVVDSAMLHVRGGGDPVTFILRLCSANCWAAFDLSTGDFISPDNLSTAAWEEFQQFRDRALGP